MDRHHVPAAAVDTMRVYAARGAKNAERGVERNAMEP